MRFYFFGDFNEAFGTDLDGIQKVAATCERLDLMSLRHSSTPPATYARRRTRLDIALATTDVANALSTAGYEPFYARFPSNYRSYFLDFDTQKLFGIDTQILGQFSDRILRLNNVAQTTQYIKAMHDMLLQHNAFERGNQLLTHPGEKHEFAERLDRDVVPASLAAEQQINKVGTPAWSLALDKAWKEVTRLTKCLSTALTGLLTLPDTSSQREVEWVQPLSPSMTIQECSTKLREAKRIVRDVVDSIVQHRQTENRERIKALSSSPFKSDKAQGQQLRRLQKAEDVNQLFQNLKVLRAPNQRQGVTRIEKPLHPGEEPKLCHEWQQIEVPMEVLFQLQQWNRMHFGQAHGATFTVDPLVNQNGFCGDGTSSEEIDNNVALLIQHLQQTAEMAALDSCPRITESEYSGKLRAWNESTSTSPSGLHLGNYKVMLSRHAYFEKESEREEETAKRQEWDHMQSSLLWLHVQVMNYALEWGYAYSRWHTVVNIILFKDPNYVRIHRKRVMHIYEADFNYMLGIKWRKALYQAEAFRELNDGQFGYRPRRNAVDPVFIEEMQFEISHAFRKIFVQTNYDAASCCDRIIPNLAMFVSCKYGVPKPVSWLSIASKPSLEFLLQDIPTPQITPFLAQVKEESICQMMWYFLSCILFDCYDNLAYAAKYCHHDRSHPIEFGMVGFVDDSIGQTNELMRYETAMTLPAIYHKLRHNAQTWVDLLGAS